MKMNFEKTYCNPIVLPDYPKLRAKSGFGKGTNWGRAGKKLLSEAEVIGEAETALPPVAALYTNVRNENYGRIAENDVRATADPTACCWDGR